MSKHDRTAIAGLLLPHFPHMAGASSDDWHAFLKEMTGLSIEHDAPNAAAFDAWRMALRDKGYPVWGHSPEKVEAMAARGRELAEKAAAIERTREAKGAELLAKLRAEQKAEQARGE